MFYDVINRGVRLGMFEVEVPRLTVLAVAAMGIRTVEWLNLKGCRPRKKWLGSSPSTRCAWCASAAP